MRRIFLASAALFLLNRLYVLLWPVSFQPVVWNPPQTPALEGVYATDKELAAVERLGEGVGSNIVRNPQDPGGAYAPLTSVQEHGGKLYFGSILESAFGRINVPTIKDPA